MARQIDIWDRYSQEENLDKKKEIKKVIIEEYINLVKIIAGKLYNYYASNIEYDDLMSYGVIGLIDAIDKYDPSKNIKFETYASIRIRGSIIDQIRNLDWIPRSIRQKSKILKEDCPSSRCASGSWRDSIFSNHSFASTSSFALVKRTMASK